MRTLLRRVIISLVLFLVLIAIALTAIPLQQKQITSFGEIFSSNKRLTEGSYGFFKWLSQQNSLTPAFRQSAEYAACIVKDNPDTHIGSPGDATSLLAVDQALNGIEAINKLRIRYGAPNNRRLQPLKVDNMMMAWAEITANRLNNQHFAHDESFSHKHGLSENLFRYTPGSIAHYDNKKAVQEWYFNEKDLWDKLRKEKNNAKLQAEYEKWGHYANIADMNVLPNGSIIAQGNNVTGYGISQRGNGPTGTIEAAQEFYNTLNHISPHVSEGVSVNTYREYLHYYILGYEKLPSFKKIDKEGKGSYSQRQEQLQKQSQRQNLDNTTGVEEELAHHIPSKHALSNDPLISFTRYVFQATQDFHFPCYRGGAYFIGGVLIFLLMGMGLIGWRCASLGEIENDNAGDSREDDRKANDRKVNDRQVTEKQEKSK